MAIRDTLNLGDANRFAAASAKIGLGDRGDAIALNPGAIDC